jgi:hypothetical protein
MSVPIEKRRWTGEGSKPLELQILRPFNRSEVLSIAEAAHLAGRSERTIRDWCLLHDLGRRIGGRWAVSKVALAMWLDGNKEALGTYLAGDRRSLAVIGYFARVGVPLPKQPYGFRETMLSEVKTRVGAG